jgi:hypothetical protein
MFVINITLTLVQITLFPESRMSCVKDETLSVQRLKCPQVQTCKAFSYKRTFNYMPIKYSIPYSHIFFLVSFIRITLNSCKPEIFKPIITEKYGLLTICFKNLTTCSVRCEYLSWDRKGHRKKRKQLFQII